MKKYIIWDWNGTLLDDLELCFHTINSLLIEEQIDPFKSVSDYQEVFMFPIVEYYRKAGFDFEKTPFSILAKRYMDRYQPASLHCPLQKDAQMVLDILKKKGLHQILLSASQLSFLKEQLSQYEIADYFQEILGLDNYYAHSKVELAVHWLQDAQVDPSEVLFIGDSLHDFEVATEANCDCVLCATGHQSKRKLVDSGCIVIDTLDELPSVIDHFSK